jgi:uncharacterized NAD(P)/FAD-binding protein YdhS
MVRRDPLIRDLLARGFARPDPLRLGLEVSEQGALVGKDGSASRRLFAIGPVTRGTFWEITAIPDIRLRVRLAHHLSAAMREGSQAGEANPKPPRPPVGTTEERAAAITALDESISKSQGVGSRSGSRRLRTEAN